MLQTLLSTVGLSLGLGAVVIGMRAALRLPKRLGTDLALTAFGAVLLLLLHLVSLDLFGIDPWYGTGFDLAKHGLELVVILMMLVAA